MAITPQKCREILFFVTYSYDISQAESDDMIDLIMKELSVTKKSVRDVLAIHAKIVEMLEEIDLIIAEFSEGYEWERIPRVEKNILRLAVYELIFTPLSPKIVIAEAIRLTKKFATVEAVAFVNAVIDAIHRRRSGQHAAPPSV